MVRADPDPAAGASSPMKAVALLRGINVGGKHLLPMKELAALFTAEGCTSVRTYIQSGNVVFGSNEAKPDELADRIALKIAQQFGFTCPVILRTAAELADTLRQNPFLTPGVDQNALHVYFLAQAPNAEHAAALDPGRSMPDRFVLHNRDIYLHLPNGMGRSKLTNAYFDSKLHTVSTARNWRTILTLHDMLQQS